MKQLNNFILEKLKINKDIKDNEYKYFPKDREELINIIKKLVKERNDDIIDLNDIDVSKIDSMASLFNANDEYGFELIDLSKKGNFDISKWDVSNVKNMCNMFMSSNFNGDISDWDVSNVENMSYMFENSKFNGDISNWDVSKVKNTYRMFYNSEYNGDISNWNVSNIKDMDNMFYSCPLEKNPPKWYKYKD